MIAHQAVVIDLSPEALLLLLQLIEKEQEIFILTKKPLPVISSVIDMIDTAVDELSFPSWHALIP